MPVSIAIIIIRPNHTKSYPKSAIIGHISGVVRRSMEVESRIQPKIIRITMNSKTTPIGGICRLSTKSLITLITPHIASVFE